MSFKYVIVVDDNGQLVAIPDTKFDPFINKRRERGDAQLADDINAYLDEQSKKIESEERWG